MPNFSISLFPLSFFFPFAFYPLPVQGGGAIPGIHTKWWGIVVVVVYMFCASPFLQVDSPGWMEYCARSVEVEAEVEVVVCDGICLYVYAMVADEDK
ncbi:hypothetical protein B0T19DRAFT_9960 [Cercophora scortea]|uniref:Uncharacterized protein n=1 Tax=Cercophora scortea TaxID=314031 RepID=A0AAE0J222_9PEZI|nr:hypothetical protein B0T19DRAFT_9960 [Cercophora scortea]